MRLDKTDLDAVAAAVAAAERRTTGEIVCAVSRRVSTYPEVPVTWAAAAALVLPTAAVALGLRPLAFSGALGEWVVAHLAALDDAVAAALSGFALLQAVVFALVWLLVSIPAVRRPLTPGWIKRARVRDAAFAHYAATGMPARDDLTGVVIFTSLEDRRVEVIADPVVHAKVEEGAWKPVAAAVVAGMKAGRAAEGLIKAVGLAGDLLSRDFPDDGGPNRLPDQPISD